MLVNYEKQDLENLRRPKKEKKQKGSRIFSRLGAKPKKTVTKSEKQKFLQQILRATKNITKPTLENINQVLTEEKVNASMAEKNVFLAAAQSQIDVKSLSVARNLVSKSFTYFFLSPFVSQEFLSNDYLYISYLASSISDKKMIAPYLKYKNVYIATQNALILNSNEKFKEYYYQDFSPECGSPNWFYTKTVDNYKTESGRQDSFYIDNIKYIRDVVLPEGSTRSAIVIYKEDFGLAKAIAKLNKLEKFYDKTELMKGVKNLDKNSGAYYVQASLKPTSFCPSILEFPPKIEVKLKYLFSYEIDIDKVFNDALSRLKSATEVFADVLKLFEFTTIDQFPNLVDFFSVVLLFVNRSEYQEKEISLLSDALELYNEFSYVIPGLSQLYKKFEKIVLQFIDSFDSGITIDKMISLYNNSSEYITAANIVNQGDTLTFIKRFKTLGLNLPMITNFFDDATTTLIMMIKKVANDILNPQEVQLDLVMEVRTLGTGLFQYLFMGEKQCICKIRSPCVFLGNLYGDFNGDTLKDNLEALKAKIAKTEDKLRMELVKEKQIISDYANNTKGILDELKKFALSTENLSQKDFINYIEKTKDVVDAAMKTKQDYTKEFVSILNDQMDLDEDGDIYDASTGSVVAIKSGGMSSKLKRMDPDKKKQILRDKDKQNKYFKVVRNNQESETVKQIIPNNEIPKARSKSGSKSVGKTQDKK